MASELGKQIASLLNRESREGRSNTPDWILANYMLQCLEAFEVATNERKGWYRRKDADSK